MRGVRNRITACMILISIFASLALFYGVGLL